MIPVDEIANGRYIHWGSPCSLYSGKTRSFLIKKNIDFVEIAPSHPHFLEHVVSKVGYFSLPVLETPTGEIIQDSTEIIDYLEQHHPQPAMIPDDKVIRALAWLIHNYGNDGLLPAAMHYRWNYKAANYDFVIDEFARSMAPPNQRATTESAAVARQAAIEFGNNMDAYLEKLGVTDSTRSAVEQSTETLFHLLNAHFNHHPYLLGGRPSVADFGLMAGLFAHLSRDPYPAQLMKSIAPALYRWTETMNRPVVTDPELWSVPPEYFDVEDLPDTLTAVLGHICSDYGAELAATSTAFDRWLTSGGERAAGTLVSLDGHKAIRQTLGEIQLQQHGVTITRQSWVDVLLTHQRLQETVDAMSVSERQTYRAILARVGGEIIPDIRLKRPVVRRDYAAVLG